MNFLRQLITIGFLLIITSFRAIDEPAGKYVNFENHSVAISNKIIDANSIRTVYRNNGSFNRDPSTGNAGFEWPKGSGKTARYASGIWLGCVAGNDTLTSVAEFSYDYIPGYIYNGLPEQDSTYRFYSIEKGNDTSYDYIHWPSNQGAYTTNDGKPFLIGDQTMFCSMVEARPHTSGSTSDSTLGAQILLTVWAFTAPDFPDNPINPLNNTIFMEYRIINRSNKIWSNMWSGLWTDDDLGSPTDDKIGCDSTLSIGYTYNCCNDFVYGSNPPAVGLVLLRGAIKATGNLNNVVKYYQPPGSNNLVSRNGFVDLGLTAFNYYNGGSPQPSDPSNNIETYRVLKGMWRLGDSWINPITHHITTLPFNGDPVTGTGWIIPGDADRRFVMSSGPSVVNPGDTITIIAAQIIARGNSNLNSITQLRRTAKVIKNFYDNNLQPSPVITPPIANSNSTGDNHVNLIWDDAAERVSYPNALSGGIHKFQGYNIYQINSFSRFPSKADTVLIKTYDIVDGVTNISDSVYSLDPEGLTYGIVQRGSDNGIARTIQLSRDTISGKEFVKGTEYKFAVTAYYYDADGGLFSLPKVRESAKIILRVTPQTVSPGTITSLNAGDTIRTNQKDLAVMPVVVDPLKLISADYTSVFGGTSSRPTWTITKTQNGISTVIFENETDFSGTQDTVKMKDGLFFIHKQRKDSGIVKDPDDVIYSKYFSPWSFTKGWDYYPEGKEWFTAPDTTAIKTAKVITNRQFESRSLGMSFPTTGTFRNNVTRVKANGSSFTPVTAGSPILTGGPLRKIKIIFGKNSQAYRYVPTDTNYTSTPYANMVTIPFSVYAADELDSSAGELRQLNAGFMDSDNDGQWDPDTTKLGNYHFTYIFASTYNTTPAPDYTLKDPGKASPTSGFPSMDVMYAWLPRVKSVNGIPQTWTSNDTLTVTPFRITKPSFVLGYPLKYSWSVKGTEFNNKEYASAEVQRIKVFPNPYYGFSELEYNDAQEKFIYISHLPMKATIYIYSLDGVPVKKINRDSNDPSSSLEKWDLKNNDGSYVASGMYIVYVDCGEFGVKTLKIAVFQR